MSEIKADALTGKTAAGNVTVTSEGGAATMQLQQGLGKAWLNHNNAHTILDSLNIASITDGGTGITNAVTFTNAMNNDDYAISGFAGNTTNDDGFFCGTGIATTNFSARIRTHNGNLNDANISCLMAHGDLA